MEKREKLILLSVLGLGAYAIYISANSSPLDTTSSVGITVGAALKSIMGNAMQTSQQGREAIRAREGVSYTVYDDGAGYPTAGIGHKIRPSDGSLPIGASVSVMQVQSWFDSDIAWAEKTANNYLKVQLSQNAFDAVVSAVFNLGSALFRNADGTETRFSQAINAGDLQSAAQYLLQFNHAGGQVVAGLTSRRLMESAQLLA